MHYNIWDNISSSVRRLLIVKARRYLIMNQMRLDIYHEAPEIFSEQNKTKQKNSPQKYQANIVLNTTANTRYLYSFHSTYLALSKYL